MPRWRTLILVAVLSLLAAACATTPRPTPTYTILRASTATALPSATATPLPPTATPRQPAGLPHVTNTPRPSATPTTTLGPWTPPPYVLPTTHPAALMPGNASQIQPVAVFGNGRPTDVAWSPNGALLAVAASDWVDLYETTTWQRIAHYALTARQVAFNPADGLLVVAAADTVSWLDLTTGQVIRTGTSAVTVITDLQFSPGGHWLALIGADCIGCGDATYALEVVDAVTGAALFIHADYGPVPAIAFSPDGRRLAVVFELNSVLLDADTGAELAAWQLGGTSTAYTPDGLGLYVKTDSGLQLLTLATGSWVSVPEAPIDDDFALSPDGQTLAQFRLFPDSPSPMRLVLWDRPTRQWSDGVPGHGSVTRLAFSPDSRRVAWADEAAVVQIVERNAPTQPITLRYTPAIVTLTFGPVSSAGAPTLLAADNRGSRWFGDLTESAAFHLVADRSTENGLIRSVTKLEYSAPAQLLLTTFYDYTMSVTAAATGQLLYTLQCPEVDVQPIRVSLGDVFAAHCGGNNPMALRDLTTGALLATYDRRFFDLLPTPNGWLGLASHPTDLGGLTLTPLTGGPMITLTAPADFKYGCLCYFAISPDGRWLAAGTEYGQISLWDVAQAQPVALLNAHAPLYGDGGVNGLIAITFSPTSNLLASAGYDDTVALWDAATGGQLRRFEVQNVSDLTFSADGRYLAASSSDGFVRVYGLPSP